MGKFIFVYLVGKNVFQEKKKQQICSQICIRHKILEICLHFFLMDQIISLIFKTIVLTLLIKAMGSTQRRNHLKEFLDKFENKPIAFKPENKPMQKFILCYLGLCFVEGYRILEKIGQNIFLLSQMFCQHAQDYSFGGESRMHGMYRIISINFVEKDLNENTEARLHQFKKMKTVADILEDNQQFSRLQFHFIFANSARFSVVDRHFLNKGSSLNINKFFPKEYDLRPIHGYKVLEDRIEGTKLHEIVQLFLKGHGVFRNQHYIKTQLLYRLKLSYCLDKVLNTICLIIGKEMIQGGYITITSEKWMRKSTVKKFKRFDLLLRNQQKVCIIDWKFSKVNANQKINTAMFAQKNRQYFQLARKQYNANVCLKFYCFHQSCDERFHRYSQADYNYEKQQIQIQDEQNENNMDIQDEEQVQMMIEDERKQVISDSNDPCPFQIQRMLREAEEDLLKKGKHIQNKCLNPQKGQKKNYFICQSPSNAVDYITQKIAKNNQNKNIFNTCAPIFPSINKQVIKPIEFLPSQKTQKNTIFGRLQQFIPLDFSQKSPFQGNIKQKQGQSRHQKDHLQKKDIKKRFENIQKQQQVRQYKKNQTTRPNRPISTQFLTSSAIPITISLDDEEDEQEQHQYILDQKRRNNKLYEIQQIREEPLYQQPIPNKNNIFGIENISPQNDDQVIRNIRDDDGRMVDESMERLENLSRTQRNNIMEDVGEEVLYNFQEQKSQHEVIPHSQDQNRVIKIDSDEEEQQGYERSREKKQKNKKSHQKSHHPRHAFNSSSIKPTTIQID